MKQLDSRRNAKEPIKILLHPTPILWVKTYSLLYLFYISVRGTKQQQQKIAILTNSESKKYIRSNLVITNSSGPVIFVRYNRGSL